MAVRVARVDGVHRLVGDVPLVEVGNGWLAHLEARNYSAATVRGYAFDVVSLARFLEGAGIGWTEVVPSDVFDWLEWQGRPVSTAGERVVRLGAGRGAAPSTMNRRVAAARGLFEYAVMCGLVEQNPVPAPRRSSGLRARLFCGPGAAACWGMWGDDEHRARGGWSVRIAHCLRRSRLPMSRRSWLI